MRLIDADKLITEYDKIHIGEPGRARKLIEEQPTVDAVDVVRCKDCVWHGEKYGDNFCNNFNVWGFKDNDYCSLGRRKETEDGVH